MFNIKYMFIHSNYTILSQVYFIILFDQNNNLLLSMNHSSLLTIFHSFLASKLSSSTLHLYIYRNLKAINCRSKRPLSGDVELQMPFLYKNVSTIDNLLSLIIFFSNKAMLNIHLDEPT